MRSPAHGWSVSARVVGGTYWIWELVIAGIVLLLVMPVVLAFVLATWRRSKRIQTSMKRLTSIDPSPTAWDYAFSKGRTLFVRAWLKDGGLVGGFLGADSYASSYPQEPNLFLEEQWKLDENGTFLEPLDDSAGLIILSGTIEVVELLGGETDDQAEEV